MSTVPGISDALGGGSYYRTPGPGSTVTAPAGGLVTSAASSDAITFAATSLHASQETLVGTYGGALSNRELLGALLLILTLAYLLGDRGDKESDGTRELLLLALIQALGQPESSGGAFMYSRSSVSLETVQFQAVASAAWAGQSLDGAYAQTMPPGEGSSLDLSA